jgi:signal recognition particle subunit SRP54
MADMPEMEEALEGDQLKHIEAIILSMTLEERHNPDIINGSRRRRIARGSGSAPQAVNQLLDQFNQMRTMMRQMSSGRGPWAKMAQQFGGGAGLSAMPSVAGNSNQGRHSGGKKTGKAARKEKRKHKARSGRR